MITLYTAHTGNGHRVSIMLEEVGIAYDVVRVDLTSAALSGSALLAVNPMGQIPAIVDTNGPGGAAVRLGESSAILRYLARKTGKLLPQGPLAQMEADRWTAIAAGGLQAAPTTIYFSRALGEVQHAAIIAKQYNVIDRYLAVMDARLSTSPYLAGDQYSYADILGFSIANGTLAAFGISLDCYPAIAAWKAAIAARPAVLRGLMVPG